MSVIVPVCALFVVFLAIFKNPFVSVQPFSSIRIKQHDIEFEISTIVDREHFVPPLQITGQVLWNSNHFSDMSKTLLNIDILP